MIVTSVQIKTVKTQKHLYCPVFTNKNLVVNTITGFLLFIFSYRKVLIIQGFYTPFVKKCCFERSNSTVGQHFLR